MTDATRELFGDLFDLTPEETTSYLAAIEDSGLRVIGVGTLDSLTAERRELRQMLGETLAALTDVFPLIPTGDDWRDSVQNTMDAARAALSEGGSK